MIKDPNLNRRDAAKLALSAVASVGALPGSAMGTTFQDLQNDLQDMLDPIELKLQPSHLEVASLNGRNTSVGVLLRAVVALHWPPGYRTRLFQSEASSPNWALRRIAVQAELYFLSIE